MRHYTRLAFSRVNSFLRFCGPTIGGFSDWDSCKRLRRAVNAYLTLRGESHRLWEYAKTPIEQKIARKVTGIDRDDWLSEFVD